MSWDPISQVELENAALAGDERVCLKGRWFSLSYRVVGFAYYCPQDGFVPAGYLDLERIRHERNISGRVEAGSDIPQGEEDLS
ncbi:MAG: hypothetical protein QXI19_07560 [Candidatus Caldarchaeum sp.]